MRTCKSRWMRYLGNILVVVSDIPGLVMVVPRQNRIRPESQGRIRDKSCLTRQNRSPRQNRWLMEAELRASPHHS
jgi:hypothetical protein